MKELDWIILTSWSAPPRTQQLQQAGLHCSLLSVYVCVWDNGEPIPPARRHRISHMNVNHLFNWLPWLADLCKRQQDYITALLILCGYALPWLCLVCCYHLSLKRPFALTQRRLAQAWILHDLCAPAILQLSTFIIILLHILTLFILIYSAFWSYMTG